jgi:hypothetical protein
MDLRLRASVAEYNLAGGVAGIRRQQSVEMGP